MPTDVLSPAWDTLENAMNAQASVLCRVTHTVPLGLQVDIDGITGFFPQSGLELGASFPLSSYLGMHLRCRILRMHRSRSSIVVGRRELLRLNKQHLQDKALRLMRQGDVVEGIVKSIAPYGVFIDLSGIDGLIKNHELAWSPCTNASDHAQIGQRLRVKIMSLDMERRHVELSLRRAKPNPWKQAQSWAPGMRLRGVVTNTVDYGYFVRLADGVEGLLHIENLGAAPKSLATHDQLEVVVLSIDADKKKMSLGAFTP